MRFDVISIFPEALEAYFQSSILKRAQAKGLAEIRVHNLRDFAADRRGTVDDRPYGGGPGMVFKVEPLAKALEKLIGGDRNPRKTLVVLLAAGGEQFDAKEARRWAKSYRRIVAVAGHYEGVDERVKLVVRALGGKLQEVSIGPYVLTGGEAPAMVLVDAVARHIPGVLGKGESLEEERFGAGLPAYTRPEVFAFGKKKFKVPPVLLSGNHAKIKAWRGARMCATSAFRRNIGVERRKFAQKSYKPHKRRKS